MFLAPSFLQGDQNKDGKLSKENFGLWVNGGLTPGTRRNEGV